MSDYDRIADAIRYIRNNAEQQPGLEAIAAHVSLSPYHFQRMFSRWAGVTPKRFLQVLTLDKAKPLIRRDVSVLDASLAVGLSSSSRLHDHFVQLQAVTPSQYKTAGENLTIVHGIHATPFGDAFVAVTPKGICRLQFAQGDSATTALQSLRKEWPRAEFVVNRSETGELVERIFATGTQPAQPLSLWVRGTNFQVSVWRALLRIPAGQVAAYGTIAQVIAKPTAARAVGTAIGANPVAYLIPCHRVLRQNGALGGYRWGEARKHAMLAREAAITGG